MYKYTCIFEYVPLQVMSAARLDLAKLYVVSEVPHDSGRSSKG